MDSNQISRFKEDFGYFIHERYVQEIYAFVAGCLNQSELSQMIPGRKGPKFGIELIWSQYIDYLNYIMLE